MTEDDVLNAACERLLEMSPRPSIVWENQHWKGSDDTLLVVETVPGDPDRRSLGGTHEFVGIFQVTVVVPRFSGVNDAILIARRLQEHFYLTTLAFARVDTFPSRRSGYDDNVNYRIPVQVRYRGFTNPATL